jgi:hypothetical protein
VHCEDCNRNKVSTSGIFLTKSLSTDIFKGNWLQLFAVYTNGRVELMIL